MWLYILFPLSLHGHTYLILKILYEENVKYSIDNFIWSYIEWYFIYKFKLDILLKLFFFLLFTCTCVHAGTYVHALEEARGWYRISLSITLLLLFWDRFSYWTWSLPICLDWLVNQLWGPPVSTFQYWDYRHGLPGPVFYMGVRELRSSDLHNKYNLQIIPMEPSLQPFVYLLLWPIEDFQWYIQLMFLPCILFLAIALLEK